MSCKCTSRRAFLADSMKLAITAGVATLVPAKHVLANDKKEQDRLTVDLSVEENAPLKTVGKAVYVTDPADKDRPIILYRKDEEHVTAFSSKCTHRGGPVGLPDKDGIAECGWHGARFDTDGKVVKRPAKKDLKQYGATLEGTLVTIVL